MYSQMIEQMDPRKLDEDTIAGLKVMLEHDSFKDLHHLINQKLAEIDKIKSEPEKVIGSFSLEINKYYQTVNGSIVKIINAIYDGNQLKKKNDNKKPIAYYAFVLQGGYVDPEMKNPLAAMEYGTTNENGAYVIDPAGRFVAYCEEDKAHPMHILNQINLKLTID
jgi:hypothetical protein